MEAFSQQVDISALRLYRAAVAHGTRRRVESIDFDSLDKVLKCAGVERAAQRGAFTERSGWVCEMWGAEDRTEISWLCWLAIGHNHSHIGDGGVTKGLILHTRAE